MTLEDHNKTLGILHLIYAGLHTLLMLAFIGIMFAVFGAASRGPNAPPTAFFALFAVFGLVFALTYTVPSYVAGYAMLKRKPWARAASIVAAVIEITNVPLGTAVGIYAFWFLFGKGEAFYRGGALTPAQQQSSLNEPRQAADSDWLRGARREQTPGGGRDYAPSGPPPDWRGE